MDVKNVLIHQTADVSGQATIGSGTRIWNHCQIRENVKIGKNCIIGKDVYVDFSVEIGDNVKIQNGALIYHGTTIESGVFIGPGAIFTNDKNPRAINSNGSVKGNEDWQVGPIHVGYGASIGAGAIILPNVSIGKFALVGAGSIVTKSVPDYTQVLGNPARVVGYVCSCGYKLTKEDGSDHYCVECGERYHF